LVAVLYYLLNFVTTAGVDYEPLTVNIQYNPAMAQEAPSFDTGKESGYRANKGCSSWPINIFIFLLI